MIDFTSNIVIGQTYLPRFFIIVEFLKTQLPSKWRVKNFYKIKSVCFQTNECPIWKFRLKVLKKIME